MLVSFLDTVMASMEFLLLAAVAIPLFLAYERHYKNTHEYDISTQKWKRRKQ
jgi:hypothetical protein